MDELYQAEEAIERREESVALLFLTRTQSSVDASGSEDREILLQFQRSGFGAGQWTGFCAVLGKKNVTASEALTASVQSSLLSTVDSAAPLASMEPIGFLVFSFRDIQSTTRAQIFVSDVNNIINDDSSNKSVLVEHINNIETTNSRDFRWAKLATLPDRCPPDFSSWSHFVATHNPFVGRITYEDDETLEEVNVRPQIL